MADIDNIKSGVIFNSNWERYALCTCGNCDKLETHWATSHTCSKCGNTNYVLSNATINRFTRHIGGKLNLIEKTNNSFKLEKQEVVAVVDKQAKQMNINLKDTYLLDFSFKDKSIKLYKNGSEIMTSEDNLNKVFQAEDRNRVINLISTDTNRSLYDIIFNQLGCERYNERSAIMGRGLKRAFKYPSIQILNACGVTGRALKDYFSDPVVKASQATTPSAILGVPKYLLPFVLNNSSVITSYNRRYIQHLIDTFDGNTVRELFKIFSEENKVSALLSATDRIIDLYTNFGYSDVKKLVTYATRDVKLQQGITDASEALTLLRDYVRMAKAMGHSYEKYPKSLKKEHDITKLNYKVAEDTIRSQAFLTVITEEGYEDLKYANKEYSVVIPQEVKAIIREGESLSHCVASYVDDVINRKCRILFIRYTDRLEESLLTVEVRGGEVKQVRGIFNRQPSQDEWDFVDKWAKEKKLEVICKRY